MLRVVERAVLLRAMVLVQLLVFLSTWGPGTPGL